jgi:hypothetical protein
MVYQAGCRGWPLGSGKRWPGIFCRSDEHRRPRERERLTLACTSAVMARALLLVGVAGAFRAFELVCCRSRRCAVVGQR